MDAEHGEAMFCHASAMGPEGIVSKRVDSRYKSGRCLSWGEGEEPGLHIATASFDHLVREQEHGGWDGHAERFSGL
jgi:hypothetical protein